MKREHIIRAFAGFFILIGLAIHQWASPWGLVIPLFVALNLIQSAITKWCLLEDILCKMNVGKA